MYPPCPGIKNNLYWKKKKRNIDLIIFLLSKAKEGRWAARALHLVKFIFTRQNEIDNQWKKGQEENSFTSSFLFHYLETSSR